MQPPCPSGSKLNRYSLSTMVFSLAIPTPIQLTSFLILNIQTALLIPSPECGDWPGVSRFDIRQKRQVVLVEMRSILLPEMRASDDLRVGDHRKLEVLASVSDTMGLFRHSEIGIQYSVINLAVMASPRAQTLCSLSLNCWAMLLIWLPMLTTLYLVTSSISSYWLFTIPQLSTIIACLSTCLIQSWSLLLYEEGQAPFDYSLTLRVKDLIVTQRLLLISYIRVTSLLSPWQSLRICALASHSMSSTRHRSCSRRSSAMSRSASMPLTWARKLSLSKSSRQLKYSFFKQSLRCSTL